MVVNKDNFILEDKIVLSDFIAKISYKMYEYMESNGHRNFVLFYKYLTYSDLAIFI